ncbi:hypothetical protein [Paenibacillus elgii]|uniref:hypothetical protein n=1 Tax=Paenibacillus elgii TaxID=189691 RepID=UPI000248E082|nr:hypothetical protein [Paenibacillus elgii]
MSEQMQALKNDLMALQKIWSIEALKRQDEAGREYAKGVIYGLELAAALLETRKPK